jgi:hypothetical protein
MLSDLILDKSVMGYTFARRTRNLRRSAIREILKVADQPDTISFAGGSPAPIIRFYRCHKATPVPVERALLIRYALLAK